MLKREIVAACRSTTFAVRPDDLDPDGDVALVVNLNLDLDGLAVEHDEGPARAQVSSG